MAETLSCYSCGTRFNFTERKRCSCGEPLWFDIDVRGVDWVDLQGETGMWRYQKLLPVSLSRTLGSAAGDTPLVRAPRLDDLVGSRIFLKDEGENPTGSFKDRGSAVGTAYVSDNHGTHVGTVSHGNMAMSTSAFAANAGLDCTVLVPDGIPEARLEFIAQYEPNLLQISGDYGQLYHDTLEIDSPVEFINSDTPLRIEGQKTVAYELIDRFSPSIPDAIVVPVSSGGHASAIWKGLRELLEADLISEMPALHLVQSDSCDPIAAAYRTSASNVSTQDAGTTIAYSIANGSPPSGNRALTAARKTNGSVRSVSDDEIRNAVKLLATHGGLCVEPASATTLAAAFQLSAEGVIGSDDDVVLVLTGSGFKEMGGAGSSIDAPTIDISELEDELEE